MSDDATQTIWLTQEAYDKLKAELDQLSGPGRAEVSQKIATAREEGDLRENGGYHAAREEQGQQEARIRQLADMLRRAEVGEAPSDPDAVEPGTRITVAFGGDLDDTDTFILGSREMLAVETGDDNVYSPQSPLGAAIVGRRKGDETSYEAPNGKTIAVTIVDVQPLS